MTNVAGVRFKTAGKIYDFDSQAFVLEAGVRVIVETEQGQGFGTVVRPPVEIDRSGKNLKQILRIATREDFIKREELMALEKQAHAFCTQCIQDLGLLMNLFCVESTFDRNKLT
ncbi:MAG: stage 0 sporulation protein, partial [Desulfotignum sp.]|nr:stage 0 sporulation protein [Desulfotignum sp.]